MSKYKPRRKRCSWREIQSLDRIFKKTGQQRGYQNEKIIEEILIELKDEAVILNFKQEWSLDRGGIDFLIYLSNGIGAIQGKSSLRGVEKHYKTYGTDYIKYKNTSIRCLLLVVKPRHLVDKTDLKNKIKKFINSL